MSSYPSKSSFLVGACLRLPRVSRLLLRTFHRWGGVLPPRLAWIDHTLRQRLCAGQGARCVKLGHGLRLNIDLSSSIGQAIYFDGSYEPSVTRFLERTLRSGMVAIDGGANVGELSLRMAQLVGPTGTVIAAEPSPTTFAALSRNIELNRLTNLLGIRAALSRHEGSMQFYLGEGACSLSSSLYSAPEARSQSIETQVTNLDRLAEEHKLSRIDLIKLDVEGAEIEAIAGADKILTSPHKPVIIVEFNARVATRAGWQLADLIAILTRYRYAIHLLKEDGGLLPLSQSVLHQFGPTTKVDLVAVPESAATD